MARSYRRPYWVMGYGSKIKFWWKRQASRAVRHASEIADGCAYRRFYQSWNICDGKFFESDISRPDFYQVACK